MKTGMLWYDSDPKSDLGSKVNRAVDYYQQKYGRRPDLCFVHPTMLTPQPNPTASNKLAGVEIRVNQMVSPNHLWIGVCETTRI